MRPAPGSLRGLLPKTLGELRLAPTPPHSRVLRCVSHPGRSAPGAGRYGKVIPSASERLEEPVNWQELKARRPWGDVAATKGGRMSRH